jgi:hypothetical protein
MPPLFRALTDTPLTRLFAQDVDGRSTQKRVEIPWSSFERAKYPTAALAVATDAMRWLATGEYTAVEGFARLTVAFSWHGVPYDLISACARIPSDEIRHSEIAVRAAEKLSGHPAGRVPLPVETRRPKKTGDVRCSLRELDVHVATLPALLETLAVGLLSEARRRASDPMMKAVYGAVLADEIHHARLGWYYLAWRAPQWSRADRQYLADAMAPRIASRAAMISDGRSPPPGTARALRALGVMDAAAQSAVVKKIMETEVVPGFDALGLGMSHAWKHSPLVLKKTSAKTKARTKPKR